MKSVLEVKSARLDALCIQLKTTDTERLAQALAIRFKQLTDVGSVPFVLDVNELEDVWAIDFAPLLALFTQYGLRIIGLRHYDKQVSALAAKHQLAFSLLPEAKADEAIQGLVAAADEASAEAAAQPEAAPAAEGSKPTVVISRPIRTGQQVYAQGADLIVLDMVSEGAEVIADGNIHVYAPLRGRALAGANGNREARIFAQDMQAELVSIAGIYRSIEQDLPESLAHKPTQIYLEENRLVMSALSTK
ncbi:MAG: septum site-determining protein MinC [Neisseriaceae bacterium]|nr:septum site-determining protein MinC [Neisseriaceae bacterium]MBP6862562.1 septum site-determining protein MinC [Neisseriaceae bacterium]